MQRIIFPPLEPNQETRDYILLTTRIGRWTDTIRIQFIFKMILLIVSKI